MAKVFDSSGVAPTCPVCRNPIGQSDATAALGGETVHVACLVPKDADRRVPGGVVERVTEIWRGRLLPAVWRYWSAGAALGSSIQRPVLRRRMPGALLRRCRLCGARDWRGNDACYACGTPFLSSGSRVGSSGSRRSALRPDLLLVSRERGDLYELVSRVARHNVEIRFDQRVGQRRQPRTPPPAPERRRAADRRGRDVSVELSVLGWTMIPAAQRRRRAG